MPTSENNPHKKTKLMKELLEGKFVYTGELEPGRTVSLRETIKEAEELKNWVVAANITDNPGAFVSMSGLATAVYVHEKTGLDPIVQLTCRDQNRLGLASTILGAVATGLHNLLLLTGDHPTLGDVPSAKPVFDLDSAQLVTLANEIRYENSIYGVPLELKNDEESSPWFHIGIAANPNSTNPEMELLKIKRKVNAGIDFIQTQVVFDLEKTEPFFKELKKMGVPVIVGLFPMKNYATARDFDTFVPGVSVPAELLNEFKKIKTEYTSKKKKHEAYDNLNVKYLKPMISELKKKGYTSGIHVTAVHYTRIFEKLL